MTGIETIFLISTLKRHAPVIGHVACSIQSDGHLPAASAGKPDVVG
jgi:hypothetical protein